MGIMSKRQRLAIVALAKQAAKTKAMAWPSFKTPPEKPITDRVEEGWAYNAHSRVVYRVWQSRGRSYDFDPNQAPKRLYTGGSTMTVPWWESRESAFQALILDLVNRYAEELVAVYQQAGISLVDVPVELQPITEE